MSRSLPVIWFERPPEGPAVPPGVTVVGPDPGSLIAADAAIVGAGRWDATQFDLAPRLRVLARTGIGYDRVDLDEATRRGIAVCNTPDGPTVSTAEHTVMLLLAVAKTVGVHQQRLRQGSGDYTTRSTAIELDGATLGLVGYGRIARRVGAAARALGMQVIACDPFLDRAEGCELVGLDDLLVRADHLSLHAPLTDETRGLIGAPQLATLGPGAILVNCARGELVDHEALVESLERGELHGAGLDVTHPEPLPVDHPLLHRDDVIVTPHVASSTVVGRKRMADMALEQAMCALRSERPRHLVNTAVWPLERRDQ